MIDEFPLGYCPKCGRHYTDKLDIEAIADFGECLSCEHISAELIQEQEV